MGRHQAERVHHLCSGVELEHGAEEHMTHSLVLVIEGAGPQHSPG